MERKLNVLKLRKVFTMTDLRRDFPGPRRQEQRLDMFNGGQTDMKDPTNPIHESPITNMRPAKRRQRRDQQTSRTWPPRRNKEVVKEELRQIR